MSDRPRLPPPRVSGMESFGRWLAWRQEMRVLLAIIGRRARNRKERR